MLGKFELDEDQLKKLSEWDHDCKIYVGPIGGKITYSFTNTNVGQIVKVKCGACDAEIDLSDYENW